MILNSIFFIVGKQMEKKKRSCPICKKEYQITNDFTRHVKTLKCFEEQATSLMSELNWMISLNIWSKNLDTEVWTEEAENISYTERQCPICFAFCKDSDYLRTHLKRDHECKIKFTCQICNVFKSEDLKTVVYHCLQNYFK